MWVTVHGEQQVELLGIESRSLAMWARLLSEGPELSDPWAYSCFGSRTDPAGSDCGHRNGGRDPGPGTRDQNSRRAAVPSSSEANYVLC